MAVFITDICICCGGCIDECPVNAIVDEDNNPEGLDTYFVFPEKCVECVGFNESPACANACPTDGCIVWSNVIPGQGYNKSISDEKRKNHSPVLE